MRLEVMHQERYRDGTRGNEGNSENRPAEVHGAHRISFPPGTV
jgi:hypothetical protein